MHLQSPLHQLYRISADRYATTHATLMLAIERLLNQLNNCRRRTFNIDTRSTQDAQKLPRGDLKGVSLAAPLGHSPASGIHSVCHVSTSCIAPFTRLRQ